MSIQECLGNTDYSIQNRLNTGSLANKGTNGTNGTDTKDVICNIYDMASNCFEWSTETCSISVFPATARGGDYFVDYGADNRGSKLVGSSSAFRPLLYLKINDKVI